MPEGVLGAPQPPFPQRRPRKYPDLAAEAFALALALA